MIRFQVNGVPVPKARPRFGQRRAYSDPKSAAYERSVAWAAKIAMGRRRPLTGALSADMSIFVPWPKSVGVADRIFRVETGQTHAVGRPDCDNYAKQLLDACNKIVYADDAIVTDLTIRKRYSDNPCVVILIWQIGESNGEGT